MKVCGGGRSGGTFPINHSQKSESVIDKSNGQMQNSTGNLRDAILWYDVCPDTCANSLSPSALNRGKLERKSFDEWEIPFSHGLRNCHLAKKTDSKRFCRACGHSYSKSVTTEEMLYDTFSRIATNCFKIDIDSATVDASGQDRKWSKPGGGRTKEGEELCISSICDVHRLLPGEFRRNNGSVWLRVHVSGLC